MSSYKEVLELLPQKSPFIFVDKILDFQQEEKTIICAKNLSFNEGYFDGHFPGNPIFPGVLMIEAMAQASVILLKKLGFNYDNFVLTGVNNVKIKKSAHPGDVLIITSKIINNKASFFFGEIEITRGSDDALLASGEISCAGIKN